MFVSLVFIAIISFSGLALTYLFAKDERFLWRLCAGNIIGSLVFGIAALLMSMAFGLTLWVVAAGLAITAAPLFVLRMKSVNPEFRHDWDLAKGKFQGANFRKFRAFSFYAFFFLLFWLFFGKAMIVAPDGIFTGGSQNLGDLPFHLGAIYSFTDGANFPPMNPSFAGAKFTYPFIADLLTACLVRLGAEVQTAMFVQNISWAFSLLVIFERLVSKVTNSRLAGKIAVPLLLFSGGFGFMWFFKDYWNGSQGLWEIFWNLPKDYTIGDEFRWGNSLTTLFITQRSLLLGMPLALVVISYLWGSLAGFGGEDEIEDSSLHKSKQPSRSRTGVPSAFVSFAPSFLVGLFAGTLPLVHAHSLAVLFVVSAVWLPFSSGRWREWLAFGAGVCVVALPELYWIMSGSATRTSEFVGWHFGFEARGDNVFWFWIKNTGIFIPLLVSALLFAVLMKKTNGSAPDTDGDIHDSQTAIGGSPFTRDHLLFYLPFFVLFIVSNLFRLAPWEWDNIKVLIYWFVGSIPLVAGLLAWFWNRERPWKAAAAFCFIVLVFSGSLDVWRSASGQIKNQVFDADAVEIAEWIRFNTESHALFLNAPTYNPAVALSGRPSLMRYIGHLSSHGIDYAGREGDVKRIYSGSSDADELLKEYGIEFVLISPREREALSVNDSYFQRFEIQTQEGEYTVYKVESKK